VSIPTLQDWKNATHKWFSVRNGAIAVIDEKLEAVERSPNDHKALLELDAAIEAFKDEKDTKYGDYKQSSREGPAQNITNLDRDVKAKLHLMQLQAQKTLVMTVCSGLFDVRIADVDFSDTVRDHSKLKMIAGKSLYQWVKEDWESDARLRDYQEHEKAMLQAKLQTTSVMGGTGKIPLTDLDKIAAVVKRHRYAVCESITATLISECKAARFGGRLEWLGIPYAPKRGHSICVGLRQGTLSDPTTWGPDYFIVDLWYYNLDLRPLYLWTDTVRKKYVDADITPFLSTAGGLKVLADIP
jgi:hypothetical protein